MFWVVFFVFRGVSWCFVVFRGVSWGVSDVWCGVSAFGKASLSVCGCVQNMVKYEKHEENRKKEKGKKKREIKKIRKKQEKQKTARKSYEIQKNEKPQKRKKKHYMKSRKQGNGNSRKAIRNTEKTSLEIQKNKIAGK